MSERHPSPSPSDHLRPAHESSDGACNRPCSKQSISTVSALPSRDVRSGWEGGEKAEEEMPRPGPAPARQRQRCPGPSEQAPEHLRGMRRPPVPNSGVSGLQVVRSDDVHRLKCPLTEGGPGAGNFGASLWFSELTFWVHDETPGVL